MQWLTAEVIQAIGIAIATIIGAFTARQAHQVKQLRERVDALEEQMAAEHARFRSAVRVIRSLLRYIDQLSSVIRNSGSNPPPSPVRIPAELEEEI
ncbi:hypothetical protein [Nocardia cyriacigeorgica]|uniref:hypothetical protein n=1 Tax=Nocardia cyriacigeorgica TaxID=135487 RepID=UPI002457115F|nr:hypothetical protein [Nocardia cyriacigeorgica]